MEKIRQGSVLFLLVVAISMMSAAGVRAASYYTGDMMGDDFNGDYREVFPGWNPIETTEKPVSVGDRFLGPTTNQTLFFMDFEDDLQYELRLVDISFDSIDPDTGLNQFVPLTVTLNGDPYTSKLRFVSGGFKLGVAVLSSNIDLSPGCCGDLVIGFSQPPGEPFGLDNLVVDWSRVPEPSGVALAVVGTFLASLRRRTRRHSERS